MEYFKDAKLSEASKKQYKCIIARWLSLGFKSMDEVMKSPEASMKALADSGKSTSPTSKHNYISAVVAYIIHCVAPEQQADYKAQWIALQTTNQEPIQERYLNQEMTDRQKGTAITWDQLMAARKAHPDNLLLGFYTYLPPVRADYNAVHLLKPTDPILENSNYIVLGTDYKVVLQEFKTAKTYKTIEHVLPEPLKKILEKSLKETPRNYLFTLQSGGPMSPNTFSAWAGRELTRLIGKKTNLTAIRHAFVHNLDYNGPLRDLKSITDSMGHSVERSMLYKLKEK
jgi:integrase